MVKLLRMFGIGAKKLLVKGHSVKGTVTMVQDSYIYVVKKPVRIGITPKNTAVSHIIDFSYTVEDIPYAGKLFIDPFHRCPQKGDIIDVYYDSEKPEKYACYPFGPRTKPIGW